MRGDGGAPARILDLDVGVAVGQLGGGKTLADAGQAIGVGPLAGRCGAEFLRGRCRHEALAFGLDQAVPGEAREGGAQLGDRGQGALQALDEFHTGDDLRQFGGASLRCHQRRQQEDYIDIVNGLHGAAFVFRG